LEAFLTGATGLSESESDPDEDWALDTFLAGTATFLFPESALGLLAAGFSSESESLSELLSFLAAFLTSLVTALACLLLSMLCFLEGASLELALLTCFDFYGREN